MSADAGPLCDECSKPVTEEDFGPTCGAHNLHANCTAWFRCRDCVDVMRSIDDDRRGDERWSA